MGCGGVVFNVMVPPLNQNPYLLHQRGIRREEGLHIHPCRCCMVCGPPAGSPVPSFLALGLGAGLAGVLAALPPEVSNKSNIQ